MQNTYDRLKQMVESGITDLRIYQSLALLDVKLGRPQSAEDWLRQGLEIHPRSYEVRVQFIGLLVSKGNFEEARVQIDLLDTAQATSPSIIHAGKCLIALVLMHDHKWNDAATTLEEVLPQLWKEPLLQGWTNS